MIKGGGAGGERWMVYDVITDELSLVRNYRTQFQRIISGQGYDGLLTKDEDQAQRRAGQRRPQAPDGSKPASPPSPPPRRPSRQGFNRKTSTGSHRPKVVGLGGAPARSLTVLTDEAASAARRARFLERG